MSPNKPKNTPHAAQPLFTPPENTAVTHCFKSKSLIVSSDTLSHHPATFLSIRSRRVTFFAMLTGGLDCLTPPWQSLTGIRCLPPIG